MMKPKAAGLWGGGRRAYSDFERDKILNAAFRCYKKNTFEKTKMDHIAQEASVSRQAIYRHFRNRDEVILGVVFREIYELVEIIRTQIEEEKSFSEFIVETLSIANEKIHISPVFELIVQESAIIMSRLREYSSDVFMIFGTYFRSRFDAAKAGGQLREGIEFDAFSDWLSRIFASFIVISTGQYGPEEFRKMLWRYLIPAIICEDYATKNELATKYHAACKDVVNSLFT